MDDADADGWRWGARARWTVFAGVLRDANALAALARSAMGTCDPARAFGAMRAREACGVTTRRGGEGTREATGRVEASRDASARTRYQGDWLDVGEVWEGEDDRGLRVEMRAGPFEPYGGRRKDCAYAVCGAEDATRRARAALMREISREYELCGLGKHEPMVEGDDGSVFEPVGDGFRRGGASTLDGFSRAEAAAQRAAELASRKSQMCVVYVIIPDDMREIDALTLIALASHVMSEATTAVDRRFLSVSVQAVPDRGVETRTRGPRRACARWRSTSS